MTNNTPENDPNYLSQIMHQVEFYMSEGNLGRDNFFKHEIEKRSDSGLLLSLLLNCNRLRALNVTEELLVRAVAKSSVVELSSDGLAVVRKFPLSELKPREKRTILVTGIPHWPFEPNLQPEATNSDNELPGVSTDDPSPSKSVDIQTDSLQKIVWQFTDKIRDTFSEYGEVLYVSLPQYFSSGAFRGFAFVEFRSPKSAKAAVHALVPKVEDECWYTAPPETESDSMEKYPECAWKPRLAAKASFPAKQMLARRHVWRCCSRKNKQCQTAFKQLRDSGYKAPNPCDREYDLITLGDTSIEFKLQYKQSCYGDLNPSKLRVFSYKVWEFWRSKFYEWLNAWINRMKLKTEKLLASSVDVDLYSVPQIDCDMPGQQEELPGRPMDASNHKHLSSKHKDKINLPADYIPKSVVQFYWPTTLVPATTDLHKPPDDIIEPEFVFKQNVSFARRLRISLEKTILAPYNLLDQISYVDPFPNDQLVTELENIKPFKPTPDEQPIELFPIFVRMKSTDSANLLINSAQLLKIDKSLPIYCRLLTGFIEERYCQFISDSHLRAKERRRLTQARRRERLHLQKQISKPSVTKPCEISPEVETLHKHIVFDD